MKLTVLGKSPAWQDAGGACSGYLVAEGDSVILVDCGNGVFGKLRSHHDYVDVDAIFVSHLHADHFMDLIPYAFALIYAPRQQPVPVDRWPGTEHPARPVLYGPPGAGDCFRTICAAFGMENLIDEAFEVREYEASEEIRVGPLAVSFREVPHYIQTFAIEVAGDAGGRLTYGADCRPNEALVEFAADTDLLIAEATLPRPERTGIRGHLTPAEAGEHASAAEAKRLLVTHISDELDPAWALAEASSKFGGTTEIAFEGMQIDI
ncbi:MAG TPA: MBL fold metallo-hydrolase [Solirubrobacterales bacterium]|nr:MBL fold metallo-hydrolase [Solirubrobacterales bacterium]